MDNQIKNRAEELQDNTFEDFKEIYKNNSWGDYDDSF